MKKIYIISIAAAVVLIAAVLSFIFLREREVSNAEEILSKISSKKFDRVGVEFESYKDPDREIEFLHRDNSKILDYGELELVKKSRMPILANPDASGSVNFYQHNNKNNLTPSSWWWTSKEKGTRWEKIFRIKKKSVEINNRDYFMVASKKNSEDKHFISAFTTCGDNICEIYLGTKEKDSFFEEAFFNILFSFDDYREDREYFKGTNTWDVYRNEKMGYEVGHFKHEKPFAPERNGEPAEEVDPYISFNNFEVRVLFCSFLNGPYVNLRNYIFDDPVTAEKGMKYLDADGAEKTAEIIWAYGPPKITTYLPDKDEENDYNKTVYIKRNNILYVISWLQKDDQLDEKFFEKVVRSFKLLPIEDEAELSSQDACSFRWAGGNFFKNNYVVQYLPKEKFEVTSKGLIIEKKYTNPLNFLDDYQSFFREEFILPGANASTFEFLGGDYGKDVFARFYKNERLVK